MVASGEDGEERFLSAWADIIAGAMMGKKRRPTSLGMTGFGGKRRPAPFGMTGGRGGRNVAADLVRLEEDRLKSVPRGSASEERDMLRRYGRESHYANFECFGHC